MRQVDELVLMDIAATPGGEKPNFQEIDQLADNCFMPMTVGGGVTTLDDIQSLLAVGADKVAINSAAIDTPELIRNGSETFGAQCIVVSIDARRDARWPSAGIQPLRHPCDRSRSGGLGSWIEALGAGEILLTSIERDGTMTGYDQDLVRDVAAAVNIPVIASGGCGNYEHMADVLRSTRAAALAAASISFHEADALGGKVTLGCVRLSRYVSSNENGDHRSSSHGIHPIAGQGSARADPREDGTRGGFGPLP